MNEQTNEQTNELKSPCVLQDIVPFGAAARKKKERKNESKKLGRKS